MWKIPQNSVMMCLSFCTSAQIPSHNEELIKISSQWERKTHSQVLKHCWTSVSTTEFLWLRKHMSYSCNFPTEMWEHMGDKYKQGGRPGLFPVVCFLHVLLKPHKEGRVKLAFADVNWKFCHLLRSFRITYLSTLFGFNRIFPVKKQNLSFCVWRWP